jgi:hypothetical protein
LELDDAYQRFFEEVLDAANEDINIASIQAYVDKLKLAIDSYLVADKNRKPQFLKDIHYTFKSIKNVTLRKVVDLKHKVDYTYKQEPDFKLKELYLKDFDEKAKNIQELIHQIEKIIDEQPIFFATAMDISLKQTISEVRDSFRESAHGLIAISAQIIDYLNRIEYQSQVVKRIRQLKYMKDQYILEGNTDVKAYLAAINDIWMEPQTRYSTRASLDFLRDDDDALEILNNVRQRLNKKATVKSRLAEQIDARYLEPAQEVRRVFNHKEIMNGFMAQSSDLFYYIWNYQFENETNQEQRLVLFLQLASQYNNDLRYLPETKNVGNIEYPIVLPK